MWNCKVLWCPADGVHQVTSGDISGMQFIWTIIMLFFDGGRGMNFETKSKVVYCIFGGENGVWKRVHTVHVLSGGWEPLSSWSTAHTCSICLLWSARLPPHTSLGWGSQSQSLEIVWGISHRDFMSGFFSGKEASYISVCLSQWLQMSERGLLWGTTPKTQEKSSQAEGWGKIPELLLQNCQNVLFLLISVA